MAAEVNAEQVEDLALIKVRGGPHGSNAVDGRFVAIEPDDEAQRAASATWRGCGR